MPFRFNFACHFGLINLRMSFSLVIDVSTPKAQRTRKLESLLEHSHAISVKIRKFSLD